MQTTLFTHHETIAAPKETVWRVLTDDALHRQWAAAFCDGAHFTGDWTKGTRMQFLDGNRDGMVSEVIENVFAQKLHVRHIGGVRGGVESFNPEDVWGEGREFYDLQDADNGATALTIRMDIHNDYWDKLTAAWKRAAANLKTLAEETAAQH